MADFKYLAIYDKFRQLIASGVMKSGSKLPSIRKYAADNELSRTTVQTAYECLLADGYITSKPQSGYFVATNTVINNTKPAEVSVKKQGVKYDLASERADSDSFDFALWQRYIKSVLRQSDRLLSYGEPQGEYELRSALADYLSQKRSVICNAYNIVIGAGFQSLLRILLALDTDKKTVCFSSDDFKQAQVIFADSGFSQTTQSNADICYVTPSRFHRKGDVMQPKERFSFVKSALKNGQMIIEDDYGSEFSGFMRPLPTLHSISGGENVVYLSTFSKLLIPSIRLSFMVLPDSLLKAYYTRRDFYNQTASKIEQLALCRFILDGHLSTQIRKVRKIYSQKAEFVKETVNRIFGDNAKIYDEDSGRYLRLEIKSKMSAAKISGIAKSRSLIITPIENNDIYAKFIISYYGVDEENLKKALEILHDITHNGNIN